MFVSWAIGAFVRIAYIAVARPFISGISKFCARGDSTYKEHLALPFICGMLPLIGGQGVTPFFQPRRE
jgi:hypothetical protein